LRLCEAVGVGVQDWDRRHRDADYQRRSLDSATPNLPPAPLLEDIASHLRPGKALDLACGTGRNALWLAQRRWNVTAVDGSAAAIEIVRRDAASLGVNLATHVADLEKHEFEIVQSAWDLILICNYFQPDLYASAIRGLARGGTIIATALLAESGEQRYRVAHGQFERYFTGVTIVRSSETRAAKPSEPSAQRRAMAEIVARRDSIR